MYHSPLEELPGFFYANFICPLCGHELKRFPFLGEKTNIPICWCGTEMKFMLTE